MRKNLTVFAALLFMSSCSTIPFTPAQQTPAEDIGQRRYGGIFASAERIPIGDVDLTLPSYFQPGPAIDGARQVRFVAADARLYNVSAWWLHRPLTAERQQVILPYESVAPNFENAFVLPEIIGPGLQDEMPTCFPSIPNKRLIVISPILGRPLVGIWADSEGAMSIVTFPNEYRCDGPTVDRRYHIIPAGRTRWREIRLTPNLHLPPAVVMVSEARVGEPITYARVQFTAAAVTFKN